MKPDRLETEAVLRIGEVCAVTGRRIFVSVDTDKNLSELFFDGDILRNIAVGSYVDIRKGFLSLIGKVEGENTQTDGLRLDGLVGRTDRRVLSIALVGFLDNKAKFFGGTKELPLIGNEAFLLTKAKVHQIYQLVSPTGLALDIAVSEYEGYDIALPVDGLMNSHIAIFGNTGSGKSNTLAIIFQEFVLKMRQRNSEAFEQNCKILLFDFNNEYTSANCITNHKQVLRLSTRNDNGDRIPLGSGGLNDIEIVSILADATEKTQKPFLKRALTLHERANAANNPTAYTKGILQKQITQILQMSDRVRFDVLMDYFREILPQHDANGEVVELSADLDWHNTSAECRHNGHWLRQSPQHIVNTAVYQHIQAFEFADDAVSDLITFAYIQLVNDVLANRAQNEHIAPAINKLKSKQRDIRKVFDTNNATQTFTSNVVVIALGDVNLEMRKTIPLLLAKSIYEQHKRVGGTRTLNIIIDEAHNILSKESFRESESWKDYRLETFEEIIKEGRKFGVFVTIASQRPNDISHTITSQAHNYFIHRLINERDLQSIASAVSYIDKITEELIPTLPTGTCIFSGIAGQMPLKLAIRPLELLLQPQSATLKFEDLVPAA